MLEISNKTNLLEQKSYKYSLQDVQDPNLYRDIYPYDEVPRVAFNHRRVPMGMPEDIWISDTSFRDGQQSVEPYTVQQIVDLFKLMSRLGGPYGIIRQSEFFVYSEKDREALRRCQELGLRQRFVNSEYTRSSIANGYEMARELFSKPIDYTAIFASTDSNALGILKAADEHGIDIPGHLSLIGFDNIPSTGLPRIDLTTIEQPKRDMAVQAVDMLRDKIENGTQGYVHQILLPALIKRGTCRALE